LLGSFKRVQDKGVVLTFDRLSAPDGRSCRVAAVALNPETTGAAVASSINHHYLERYGTLLASAFLQGYGEAVLAANTTYVVSPLGGATVVSALPKSQEFLYALGQVGQELGANMRSLFNIPPTIKVAPGTALAILFLGTPKETKQAAPVTTAPAAAQGQSAAAPAQGAPAAVAGYGTGNLPPNILI
jgi:intracellular multiplication protein IcmE